MLEQVHISPNLHTSPEGVKYRLIAGRTTNPRIESKEKQLRAHTTTVEVIISDSQPARFGSQFGHAAIVVKGIAYSRAPRGYDSTNTYAKYVVIQQSFRNSIGYVLRVSPDEERRLEAELKRRVHATNDDPGGHPYSLLDNSCSSNVVDALHLIGILAHDPRGFGIVSPADVAVGLSHSDRIEEKRLYRKAGS